MRYRALPHVVRGFRDGSEWRGMMATVVFDKLLEAHSLGTVIHKNKLHHRIRAVNPHYTVRPAEQTWTALAEQK